MISFDYLASPGQLGNQMFKYAALRGISAKLKKEFLMPPSYNFLNNKFLFKVLNRLDLVDNRNHSNHLLFKYFQMKSVSKDNIGYSNYENYLKEGFFHFDESFFSVKDDSFNILGNFQSYKYFENISDKIITDFTFKDKILTSTINIINRLDNPISIHIRRGDFVTNPNHTPLDLDYYKKCIEDFGKNHQYLIFSDDIGWCKDLDLFKPKNYIFANDYTNNSEYLDLSLMTLCKNHIVANSTFSWWGAYLSKQEKVLVPKYWFKDSEYSEYNTSDLYPLNWIQIDN